MNKEKFLQLIRDFNQGDFEKFVSTYYTEDAIFETPDYRFEGREEIKKFFLEIHKGMDETLRVEKVLVDGNNIAADVLGDLCFTEDRPDFRMMPMKKGGLLRVRFFVLYETKDDRICEIRICRRSIDVVREGQS